jgi:hypothetical protein
MLRLVNGCHDDTRVRPTFHQKGGHSNKALGALAVLVIDKGIGDMLVIRQESVLAVPAIREEDLQVSTRHMLPPQITHLGPDGLAFKVSRDVRERV